MQSIKQYEQDVSHPGKFESEPRFTPYFYDLMMDGDGNLEFDCKNCSYNSDECEATGSIRDCANFVTSFDITEEDIKLFPELKGYKKVGLKLSDQGFASCYLK